MQLLGSQFLGRCVGRFVLLVRAVRFNRCPAAEARNSYNKFKRHNGKFYSRSLQKEPERRQWNKTMLSNRLPFTGIFLYLPFTGKSTISQ